MLPTRRPCAALLACVLAACGPEPHEARLPLRVRAERPDTLVPGDRLRMEAHLHNPTRQPLRMEFADQCQVEFYVQGPDRTVLHPPGGGATCVGAPSVLEIPPGDSVRFEASWLATYGTLGEHVAYAVLWPYRVPHGEARVEREGHRSNVIVFPVLPPPE